MEPSDPQFGNLATEPDTKTFINRTESFDSTVSETGAVPGGLVFWDQTGKSVRTKSVRALTDQVTSELQSSPSATNGGQQTMTQREKLVSQGTEAKIDVWAGVEAFHSPRSQGGIPQVDVQRDGWMDDGPETDSTVGVSDRKESPDDNPDASTRLVGHEEVEVQENAKSGSKKRYSSEQSSVTASTPATPIPLSKTASKLAIILSKNRDQMQSISQLEEEAGPFAEEQLPPVFSEARAKELQQEYTLYRETGVLIHPSKYDWRKDRMAIDAFVWKVAIGTAIFANIGNGLAVLQHEFITSYNHDPRDTVIDALKLLNTLCTIITMAGIITSHYCFVLFHNISLHLHKDVPYKEHVKITDILYRKTFIIEMIILVPHLPPGVTFEFVYNTMGNFIVHRGESLFSLWNSLRFYLVWRVIKYSVFHVFPKRHTVSRFWSIKLQSQYAFKHLLNSWMSVVYIALTWLFWICLSAYWYRAFELTACNLETTLSEVCKEERAMEWIIGDDVIIPDKTIYFQNTLWLMFVTSTTVGYGDLIPSTHFGRATACVTGLMGTMLASLLIASISNVLAWTPKEKVAIALLEREQARFDLQHKAARLLLAWLKTRREKRAGRKPNTDFFSIRRDFYLTKAHSRVLVEDCIGDSAKIESIARRVKKSRQAITALSEALYCPDLLPGESQVNWEHDRYKSMIMKQGPPATPDESLKVVPEQKLASMDKSNKTIERNETMDRNDSAQFDEEMEDRITAVMSEAEKREYLQQKEAKARQSHKSVSLGKDALRRKVMAMRKERQDRLLEEMRRTKWDKLKHKILCILPFSMEQPNSLWRSNYEAVEKKLYLSIYCAASLAMFGLFIAMVQNEMVFQDVMPDDVGLNLLKMIHTIITGLALVYIVQLHWLKHLARHIKAQLSGDSALGNHVPVTHLLADWILWVELIVVGVHLPPFCTFEWYYETRSNIVTHRGETVACLFNCFRVYLVARSINGVLQSRLHKRQAISKLAKVDMGWGFSVKMVLNSWSAFVWIAAIWMALIMLFSYWFRSAEITGCLLKSSTHWVCEREEAKIWMISGVEREVVNVFYIQSGIWFTVITSLTVGYGDVVPLTHLGRLLAGMTAVVGIVTASLLAAALRNALEWTNEESVVGTLLEREKNRMWMRVQATRVIQAWWFDLEKRRLSFLVKSRLRSSRIEFGSVRETAESYGKMDLDEMDSVGAQIEQLNYNSRFLHDGITIMSKSLYATLDNGWHPPGEHFDIKLDDTITMTDIERHLFDRIVSQRMMMAQGAAPQKGGWRIAQAAANIVRIKHQLKLSKGRRVQEKKAMIVGTQQVIRQQTLTQGKEHITPQGLKKERSRIQEKWSHEGAMTVDNEGICALDSTDSDMVESVQIPGVARTSSFEQREVEMQK